MPAPSLLIDTGAFIALAEADDDLHREAAAFYRTLPAGIRQVTTQAIVAETYTFFRYHHGRAAALSWLGFLDGARSRSHLAVLCTDAEDGRRAEELLRRFADHTLSYVDALTLATLERAGIDAVFAFDHHLMLTGRPILPGALQARGDPP